MAYSHHRFMDRMEPIIEAIDPRVNEAGKQISQVVFEEILSKIPWPSFELYERATKCWQDCNGQDWYHRLLHERKRNSNFPPIFWQLNQVQIFLSCYRLLKRWNFQEFAHLPERIMAFVIRDIWLRPTEYALNNEGMLVTWHHDEQSGNDTYCPIEEKDLFMTWYILYPGIWQTFGILLSAASEAGMATPSDLEGVAKAIVAIYASPRDIPYYDQIRKALDGGQASTL